MLRWGLAWGVGALAVDGAAEDSLEREAASGGEAGFQILWKRQLDGWAHMMTIQDGVVYSQWAGGTLSAVDLHTGEVLRAVDDVAYQTAPIVTKDRVYSYRVGELFELDRSEFTVLRQLAVPGGTYSENLGYDAATGTAFVHRDVLGEGVLSALRLEDGSIIWETGFSLGQGGEQGTSPLVIGDDSVYVQGANGTNRLWRLDKRTGAVRWVAGMGGGATLQYNNPIYDRARDVIYASTLLGEVFAVRREDGHVLWSAAFPRYQIRSTLTYHDGTVYVPLFSVYVEGAPGASAALDATTGKVRWLQPTVEGDDGWSAMAVCDRYLYQMTHGEDQGQIVVRDRLTGELVWSVDVGEGQPCTNPVQSDGIVVFGGVRSLIAVRVGVGQPVDCPWHGVNATGYNPGAIIWDGVEKHPDVDADGLPDAWEVRWFGHLFAGEREDRDGDGLTNLGEYALDLDPHSADGLDRLSQSIEVGFPREIVVTNSPVPLRASATSGLPVTFRVLSGPASVTGEMLELRGVGRVRLAANQRGNETFRPVSVEWFLEVKPAAQSMDGFVLPIALMATNGPVALRASASSGLPVTFRVVGGPARVVEDTLVLLGAGLIRVLAEQGGNDDFLPTSIEQSLLVTEAAQALELEPLRTVRMTDSPVRLEATASSGLPVVFEWLDGPGVLDGNVVVLLGEGLIRLRAQQVGDAFYQSASREQVILVDRVGQVLEAFELPAEVVATNAPLPLHASASSGLPVTFVLASGLAEIQGDALVLLGAGQVRVTAEQAGNEVFLPARAERSVFVRAAEQAIQFEPAERVWTADSPVTLRATATSGLPVSFVLVDGPAEIQGDQMLLSRPGVITLRAEQAGNAFYQPASTERMLVAALPDLGAALAEWIASRHPGVPPDRRGLDDDPDGDSAANLIEYLLGSAPDVPGPGDGRLPTGQSVVTDAGPVWDVVFDLNPELPGWVPWKLEVCDAEEDFVWEPVPGSMIERDGSRIHVRIPSRTPVRLLRLSVTREPDPR